ncbi:GatB/YqeY domain-containing protein [Candidatus Curtissbacteria bacterium]|nr:GatB/YqeY domain-containing protein [Candidatus Curtissbacteria bacterium]
MAALLEQLNSDLTEAQKVRNTNKVSTLRFLLSQVHNAKIAKGAELSDQEVESEIVKEAKRHRESIIAYTGANRTDLVEKEQAELGILEAYLPTPLTDAELRNFVKEAIVAVNATGPADMGRVVKAVLSSAGSKADGGKVAQIAQEELAGAAK